MWSILFYYLSLSLRKPHNAFFPKFPRFVGKILIKVHFYIITSPFYPAMPGDSKDFIDRKIIQALPSFYTVLIFLESNQDILYHK